VRYNGLRKYGQKTMRNYKYSKTLGSKQRKVMDIMIRYGGGYWQPGWRLLYDRRQVLATLVERGLVEQINENLWKVVHND
jgi:hypothetical protein